MAHSHFHAAPEGVPVTAAELYRHRRALRILVVVLVPLGVWTLVGLIALWPGDVASHVNSDVAGYSVPGVTYPRAKITEVEPISCDGLAGSTPGVSDTRCANLTAEVLEGAGKGSSTSVPLTQAISVSGVRVGQVIKLIRVPPADGQSAQYQFSDFERRVPLLVFALIFVAVVVAVARWRGFASLVGLGFAGFILVKFVFPALVSGQDPILIGLIGSSAIMFVVLYAAHGFSARTTTALVGTLFGLIVTAGLGFVATRWAHLTGVAAEEDYVLASAAPDLRLTSVVICGIIVAGLGVLNDVTITQASAVWELADDDDEAHRASAPPSGRRLFTRAMRIGRDHIASTVYTIAFATAGASLSVLLLIAIYDRPLLQVLQTEQFSGEVIRTLVGSIGLVLAVPLTTAVAVAVVRASRPPAALYRGREAATAAPPAGRPSASGAQETAPTEADVAQRVPADPGTDAQPETRTHTGTGARTGTGAGADTGSDAKADTDPKTDAAGSRRRRRRQRADDDFDDFSDLRDPDLKPSGRRPPNS